MDVRGRELRVAGDRAIEGVDDFLAREVVPGHVSQVLTQLAGKVPDLGIVRVAPDQRVVQRRQRCAGSAVSGHAHERDDEAVAGRQSLIESPGARPVGYGLFVIGPSFHPCTKLARSQASAKLLSAAMARSYAEAAESQLDARYHCSPCRQALMAVSDDE